MIKLTLLAKIYGANQRKQIDETVKNLFEGLSVEATVSGAPTENWVQVALSGEDEEIAKNLLSKEFGFCPSGLESVEKLSVLKGFVTGLEKNSKELLVDAELSDEQIEKFTFWRESLLDRLLILGAPLNQVKMAVEQAEIGRDVIDIESLGMFEHA